NIIRTDVVEKSELSVEQIVNYISDNSSTVTLQSTADHFHYSTAYISRLISQRTNKTFSAWLSEFKVQKATTFLKSTDLELEKIAQMVGYMERRSFEKAFKQHMGITPSQYRKQSRSTVYAGS
ncbi:MAG: helix-turn-helix transcriptional regulator, partial [Clostridiales bacterium]|nr:helix-turn-helix transcriptional regulator [Clostridiales bacterium]